MNDGISGAETPQQNEVVKHSFKSLKTQAKTLIYKGVGGVWQQSLLHRKELKDNGTQISQVKESLFWKQKAPIEKTLESGGLVIRLARKENKSIKTYFLFEPRDLEKGKKDMDLKSIVIDNPINKRESYKIDLHDDGSIKITRTDGKGVESEISAEQFTYLKEIDALKNILSIADDKVKKTVKMASVFAGTSVAGLVAGAGIKPAIEYFTKLKVPNTQQIETTKAPLIEAPKSEYQYDPSLVEKVKQIDTAVEKIKRVYGVDFDYISFSYDLLKGLTSGNFVYIDKQEREVINEEIINFLNNRRSGETEARMIKSPEFLPDEKNADDLNNTDQNIKESTSKFIQKIFYSFIKKDTGRINKILFASNTNGGDGKLNSYSTSLGKQGEYFSWDEIKNFIHETSHNTNGLFQLFEFDESGNIIHINGYRSDHIADQLVEWTTIFADNPEFFNKYFFNIQGDGTFNFFKESNSLQRPLNEIMAISCTNYFVGERANWTGDQIKQYPDIERAFRRQLAVNFYGGEALTDFPNGLDNNQLGQIRKEFGRNYIFGLIEQMGENDPFGQAIVQVLSSDLSKYYSPNTSGYFIEDGKPNDESNSRFIYDNSLDKNIKSLKNFQNLTRIEDFIAKYGRTFFPDGKIE